MTKEEKLVMVNGDLATVEIIGLLLSFLEGKGVLDRSEFIAFSRETLEFWKRSDQSAGLAAALKLQIDSLDLDLEEPRAH